MSEVRGSKRNGEALGLVRDDAMAFAGIGLYRYGFDGTVLLIDRGTLRILELEDRFPEPEMAVGKNIAELVIYTGPEGRMRTEIRERGRLRNREWHFRTLSGAEKWVVEDSYLVQEGDQESIQVVVRDITEQKRTQASLHEREVQYARTLDSMADAIHLADPDLRIILLNAAFRRWMERLGLDANVMGRKVLDAFPFLPEQVRDEYGRVLETGEMLATEETVQVGGREFITETRKIPILERGKVTGILTVVHDATERKRAERALRESEEKYRNILESIQEGYYEVDLRGSFTFFNKALCQILGYSEEETLGLNYRAYYPDEAAARNAFAIYHQVYETGQPVTLYDWEMKRKDGSKAVLGVSVSLMHDAKGNRIGFRGIALDVSERKRVERALQEVEARARALLNAIPDTMMRIRKDGMILDFRPGLSPTPDLPPIERIVGSMIWETAARDLAEQAMQYVGKALDTGVIQTFEFQYPSSDGPRDYEVRLVVSGEEEALAIIRNISERKRAEHALRQSEARFQDLFDKAPVGYHELDMEGYVIRVNQTELEMLGYTVDEMLGRPIWEFALESKESREAVIAKMSGAAPPGRTLERTYRRKDGTLLPVLIVDRLLRNERGQIAGIRSTVQDISALKRAERALRESEEQYRELFENANDIVYTHDPSGRFASLNKAGERISGYTQEEALTMNALDIVAPEYRDLAGEMVARKLAGEEPTRYELEIVAKDGRRIPVEVSTRLIRKDGVPIGIQGIARDMTERRRAEEERRRLEAQVQHAQKLECLGVLAGGIAHDFNNLLVGILGYAGLALTKVPPESPARGYIENIEASAQRAAELTNQMLAYSGRGAFVTRPLNLSTLVHEVGSLLSASISKKAVLKYECASDLPLIIADPTQMHQVIMNLITNASDALGGGPGVITLCTQVTEVDRPYLSKTYLDDDLAPGRYVCIEVSDTGCGMDKESQARIFDPFFSTKFAGRGLGLAAVLGIVRGHKGAVKVYSEVGQGTTFKVLFPVAAVDAEEGTARGRIEEGRDLGTWRGSGLILVADDEESARSVARETLEQRGFTVVTAEDGQEAVAVFRDRSEEIVGVLLDLTMPVMSGTEAFEKIQEIRSDVPVILSSGYTEQDATTRFAGAVPFAFIQKPYVVVELIRKFHRALTAGPRSNG